MRVWAQPRAGQVALPSVAPHLRLMGRSAQPGEPSRWRWEVVGPAGLGRPRPPLCPSFAGKRCSVFRGRLNTGCSVTWQALAAQVRGSL